MDEQINLTDFITTETKEHQLRTQNLLFMILELERQVIKKRADIDVQVTNIQRDFEQKLIDHERNHRKLIAGLVIGAVTVMATLETILKFI